MTSTPPTTPPPGPPTSGPPPSRLPGPTSVGPWLSSRPRSGPPFRLLSPVLLAWVAVLLIGGLLALPIGWTFARAVAWSLSDADPEEGLNLGHLVTDPQVLRVLGNSLLWVLVALALVVVGFAIARRCRAARLGRVLVRFLVLPFAVSALAAGAAFRLLFDPAPERGLVTALTDLLLPGDGPVWLGPGWWIWAVVISAFAWIWLGFIVALFYAGMRTPAVAVTPDPENGGLLGRWRALSRAFRSIRRTLTLPTVQPISIVVVLTVLVAAVRVFDLVLITAPSSAQDRIEVLGVHWWRRLGAEPGEAATIAVLLFAVLAVIVLLGRRLGVRGGRPVLEPLVPEPGQRRRRHWLRWPAAALIIVLWLVPALALVATSIQRPIDAAVGGWWSGIVPSTDSFLAVFTDSGLLAAMVRTLMISTTAAFLVVVLAIPASYQLRWGRMPIGVSRAIRAVLPLLVVAPVQMYAGPIRDLLHDLGVSGSVVPLIAVHTAAGLPFAILVLHAAFGAAGGDPLTRTAWGHRLRADTVWHDFSDAILAVLALEFILVWNDFILGFLISGPGASPFTLVLWGEARQFALSSGTVAASATAATLIPLLVLLVAWPKIEAGLAGGVRR